MTNGKRRRLAKVRAGGEAGSPSPLGNRHSRRHGGYNPEIDVDRDLIARDAPAPEAAVDAAVE